MEEYHWYENKLCSYHALRLYFPWAVLYNPVFSWFSVGVGNMMLCPMLLNIFAVLLLPCYVFGHQGQCCNQQATQLHTFFDLVFNPQTVSQYAFLKLGNLTVQNEHIG